MTDPAPNSIEAVIAALRAKTTGFSIFELADLLSPLPASAGAHPKIVQAKAREFAMALNSQGFLAADTSLDRNNPLKLTDVSTPNSDQRTNTLFIQHINLLR